MSVCTPTAIASEAQRERAISPQGTPGGQQAGAGPPAPADPRGGQAAAARAPVPLVVLHSEEAQLAHARPDGLGDLAGRLPLLDVGLDLLLHEGPDRLTEEVVVLLEDLHDRSLLCFAPARLDHVAVHRPVRAARQCVGAEHRAGAPDAGAPRG